MFSPAHYALTSPADSSDFCRVAYDALNKIAAGDLKFLARQVDTKAGGILVTRRVPTKAQMYNPPLPIKEPVEPPHVEPPPYDTPLLVLGGLRGYHSEGLDVFFPMSELGNIGFRRVFRQFQRLIRSSLRDTPGEIEVAENLYTRTHQIGEGCRYIGPAAEGRLDGQDYWRVGFVRQRDGWRIWLLEMQYS